MKSFVIFTGTIIRLQFGLLNKVKDLLYQM